MPLRTLILAVMVFFLAGCAAMRAGPGIQLPAGTPTQAFIRSVPFFAQKKYQCGPAALAMVMTWGKVATTPDKLAPMVYVPDRKGSLQSGLITAARRHQRLAYVIQGLDCLIKEVGAGQPVIVLQNLGLSWIPRWHYAVVIGYDLDTRQVILHTGTSAARRVGIKAFMNTWRRAETWGLCILTPGRMPPCAQELPYLKAALGLLQDGHRSAAAMAFEAAVHRWPDSAQAYLALGNARYAEGLLPQAAEAFLAAVNLEPDNGDALNNLAHSLAASGDFDQAETLARRAIAIGGAHVQAYRRTLDEILLKRPH